MKPVPTCAACQSTSHMILVRVPRFGAVIRRMGSLGWVLAALAAAFGVRAVHDAFTNNPEEYAGGVLVAVVFLFPAAIVFAIIASVLRSRRRAFQCTACTGQERI